MTSYRIKALVFWIILMFSNHQGIAQNNPQNHKAGLGIGFGSELFLDVTYTYKVVLIQGQYFYTLSRNRSWEIDLNLTPQFNFSTFKDDKLLNETESAYEAGLNVSFLLRKQFLNRGLSWYIGIGAGPHFISDAPRRQSNGFIFSDNIFAGISLNIRNNLILDIRPGFRHISNAGIKNPNGGVNSILLNLNIIKVLK